MQKPLNAFYLNKKGRNRRKTVAGYCPIKIFFLSFFNQGNIVQEEAEIASMHWKISPDDILSTKQVTPGKKKTCYFISPFHSDI
jgi:hypothetical protein